jgi:hypothetical protein
MVHHERIGYARTVTTRPCRTSSAPPPSSSSPACAWSGRRLLRRRRRAGQHRPGVAHHGRGRAGHHTSVGHELPDRHRQLRQRRTTTCRRRPGRGPSSTRPTRPSSRMRRLHKEATRAVGARRDVEFRCKPRLALRRIEESCAALSTIELQAPVARDTLGVSRAF